MSKQQRTPFSRVFLIEDRAGPSHAPAYQGLTRAMGPSWDGGDTTPVRQPSATQYNRFDTVDVIRGAEGLPQLPLQWRYPDDQSEALRLFRKRCPFDVQVHMGSCQNPQDFNGGWTKILNLDGATMVSWGTGELGALDQSEDATINEDTPLSGLNLYEILRILPGEIGAAEIVQEVIAVSVCDSAQCGECGISSDGCQVVFALTVSQGGSPGLPAELIYSQNQGTTLGQTNISTLAANEDPTDATCIGIRYVAISDESCSLHYALIADILAGTETWTEVTSGFVCPAGAPNAIFSAGPLNTFIVGDGGYIYFTADPTSGVTVSDAGSATTEDLLDVHGIDDQNVVAVGANNAVVVTANGGLTWASVTGPAAGVALNTVVMRTPFEWMVGAANGRLYYTTDAGATWTEKAFPGSGAGQVRDITFATSTVGYMAHDIAGPAGRILRTIDGGYSWYVIPEVQLPFPDNDRINAVASCAEDPNFVLGGGLGANGSDGFLVRAR